MSTAERSTLISQAASLLNTMADDPKVGHQQHRDLEIGLCRRKIEMYEDLSVRTPGDTDVLAALAGARARLAKLQADRASISRQVQ